MAGIYIHIPLCRQACYYCDFHFSTLFQLKSPLIKSLQAELKLRRSYLGEAEIETIYLGGGTPSVLDVGEIEGIIMDVFRYYRVSAHPEITIEANPDDLNENKLRELMHMGFNRLSIGMQSFHDPTLRLLNRVHNAEQGLSAVEHAVKAGFENINLDLIYAISEGHMEVLKNDLRIISGIRPQHISAYCLTIEPKTVFGNWSRRGKFKEVSSEQAADEMEYLIDELVSQGYDHYEVSNFSLSGFLSRHNSNYWKGVPYLGIGPSAHSFDGSARQVNIRNNALYIKELQQGNIPVEVEHLTRADHINEYLLTGLRTSWGVDLNLIRENFGVDIAAYYKNYIQDLIDLNYATFNNGKLQLLKKGMLIADKICSDLFYVDEKG